MRLKEPITLNKGYVTKFELDDPFLLVNPITLNENNMSDTYTISKGRILSFYKMYPDFTGGSIHMSDGMNKKHILKPSDFINLIRA